MLLENMTTLQKAGVIGLCAMIIIVLGIGVAVLVCFLLKKRNNKTNSRNFNDEVGQLLEVIKNRKKDFEDNESAIEKRLADREIIALDIMGHYDKVVEILENQLGNVALLKEAAKEWQAIAEERCGSK